MYAVIKTGGKQYRVQPGDLLVVERLDGEPGAELAFNEVLMLGDAGEVTVGAPLVDGAVVRATLIETRKGEKVKVFKKIRRQGYRRTKGHRQVESVLRVTGLEGGGKSAAWEGTVDLTPRSVLVARARNLAPAGDRAFAPAMTGDALVDPETEGFVDQQTEEARGGSEATTAAKPARRKPATKAAAPLPDPEAEGFVDQQTEESVAEQRADGDAQG